MKWSYLSVAACSLLIAACDREATGQVAAVVNGDEITLQEVNAEMAGADIPAGISKEEVQKAALQRIVDRRLLADSARQEDLDKSPDFLIRQRQLEDALLVQLLGQKLGRTVTVPTEQDIDAFIKANPSMFANRTAFKIDRIQFQAPDNPAVLKALQGAHSMDAVVAVLQQYKVPFAREPSQMDSARLGEERLKQILSLPAGEPFLINEGTTVTVGIITGRQAIPVAARDAQPLATQALRNENLAKSLKQRLTSERNKAKIEYKEGFAPAAPAGAKPSGGAPD
jgi:EpsD family peptidyl-prolyl cis-trans isomerase